MAASISAPVSGSSGCRTATLVSSPVVITGSFPTDASVCTAVHTSEVSPLRLVPLHHTPLYAQLRRSSKTCWSADGYWHGRALLWSMPM